MADKGRDASNNLNLFKFRGGAGVVMIIKSTGVINLSNVPTGSAGLVSSGDTYQTAGGVLHIVP